MDYGTAFLSPVPHVPLSPGVLIMPDCPLRIKLDSWTKVFTDSVLVISGIHHCINLVVAVRSPKYPKEV